MADYQNKISLGIKLQPSKEVQNELESLIRQLEKDSNIDLNIDTKSINKSLNDFSNALNDISNKIKNDFNFQGVFSTQIKGVEGVTTKLKEEQDVIKQIANISKVLSNTKVALLNDDGTIKETLKDVTKIEESLGKIQTLTKDGKTGVVTAKIEDSPQSQEKIANQIQDAWDKAYKQRVVSEKKAIAQIELDEKKAYDNEILRLGEKAIAEQKAQDKIENIKSTMQSKLTNSKNNEFIDESVIINLQNKLNSINTNTAEKEIKELQTIINNLSSSDSQIVRLQNAISKMETNLTNMKGKYGSLVGDSSSKQQLDSYTSQIEKLKTILISLQNGGTISGQKLASELNLGTNASRELSTAVKNSSNALRLAQKDATTFGESVKQALQNAGIYMGTYQAIQLLSETFKSSIRTVIDMDTALGNLNKVANMSSSQLLQMRDSAVEMGKQLGRSSIEIANAQAEFGKLYKTQNEINEMTKVSVMGANVMDNVTSAEVAKGLTTTITSMKLQAKDAMTILDSLNEVQNNYRISAKDLLDALSEVGSTAYTSGAKLQQVEGYITAIGVATGKSGDEIGNSLKSMMSRVYKLGTEGLEAEGKPEQMLKEMGVAVRDSGGNFRDFSSILSDLDVKWQTMSDTQKIATAQVVAGVHRYNDFMSLMNNYKMAVDSSTTALNSQGSATRENSIHLQTAEAKLGVLKATLEEMYLNMVNSDTVKSAIDGLTLLVKTFGDLPNVIILATTALLVFKGQAIMGAIAGIGSFINIIGSATKAVGILELAQIELNALMSTNPLGLLAVVVTTAVVAFTSLHKSMQETTDDIISQSEEVKKLNDSIEDLETKSARLNELSSKTDLNTDQRKELVKLNNDLASQYPELISYYNSENESFQINAKSLQELIDKKRENAMMENALNLGKSKEEIEKYKKEIDEAQNLLSKGKKTITTRGGAVIVDISQEDKEKAIQQIQNANENISKLSTTVNQGTKYINDYFSDFKKQGKSVNDTIEALKKFGYTEKDINDALALNTSKINENAKITDLEAKAKEESAKKTKLLSEANKELQSSNGSLSNDTIKRITDAYPEVENNANKAKEKVNELNNAIKEAHAKEIQNASDSYAKSAENIAKCQGFLDKLNKSQAVTPTLAGQILKVYPEISTEMGSVSKLQDALNGKIKEQQASQAEAYLTMMQDDQSFYQQKIANNDEFKNAYNNFLSAFVADGNEAGSIDFNNYKTYAEFKKGSQNQLGVAIEAWLTQYVGVSAKGYADDFANFRSTAEQKANVLKKLNDQIDILNQNLAGTEALKNSISTRNDFYTTNGMTDPLKIFNDEVSQKIESNTSAWQAQIDKIKGAKKEIDTTFDEFGASMKGFTGGGLGGTSDFSGTGGGSKDKSAKKAQELAEDIAKMKSEIEPDRYYELNNAIKAVDASLTSNKILLDSLKEGTPEYQQAQLKDIELYKQKQIALQNLNNEQKKESEEIKNKLASMSFQFDANGKLLNSQQRLLEMQESINAMGGNTEEDKENKKNWIDWLKEINNQVKKYAEITEDTIPKTINEYNELANSIKKVQEETRKANEETLKNFRDTLAQDILKESQDEVDKLKEDLKNSKENEIKEIEDRKKSTIESYDEQIKSLQEELNSLDDESVNNQIKLKKLQQELSEWQKDDSTEAQGKIQDLNEKIKDLQKTIEKDSLQKEIDVLNEQKQSESDDYDKELDDLNNYYDEQEKTAEDTYKEMLSEKRAYAKADKLITENDQESILKILEDHSESYKDVGTLLGTNFRDAFIEQIQQAKDALSELMNTNVGGNGYGGSSSNNYESSTSSGTNYTVIDGGIISDSPLTNEDQDEIYNSSPKNSSGSDSKYQGGTTSDGQTFYFASYDTGGRTPSNIDNGALGVLHSDEKILNAEDTIRFDKGISQIDEIYNMIKSTGSILSQQLLVPNGYSIPNILSGVDLNKIANSITNNTTENSNSSSIEINNTYQVDATSDFNTKNFSNNLDKKLKNTLRRFGKIK